MNQPAPIISVRNVVNRFGAQTVHEGVSLDVYPGEVIGIVGGSGTGKSVLLRTMLGLHRPVSGQVLVEGRNVCGASEEELLEVKRRYGVTFQHGALFSSLTVAQNIQLPIREYFDASPATLAALTELRLRMVGLSPDAASKLPSQLSGGMIKRAALARALALDPISAASFDELVAYLHRGLKLTIVMITHDLDTLLATCNRVAVLIDSKIVVDTLDGIMKNPHPWIQEYFHGPRARAAQVAAGKGG